MNRKKIAHEKVETPQGQLNTQEGLFIVGIGASAGGIQALQEFFRQVPADSDMAYVVILHLSPSHDSQLAHVLQQETKMPVTQVIQKTPIQADHIYVIPPDRHLTMEDGYIAVSPNLHIEERRAPVDIFFRSLAEQHRDKAISVVLSGTGANGSMGLKRIKERGGATYAQNPREAEFNEMPRNAIATELIDEILNVSDIPGRIIAYRNGLGKVQLHETSTEEPGELQQQALRAVFTQLKIRTGHDFSNYKRPTLLRRIERRINVNGLEDLRTYLALLNNSPEETHALLKDLLISVTNFFRDKEAFECLEREVIPEIFAGKTSNDQVRIWVAGCATGEEAYSIAILCAEQTLRMFDAPKVQIFATDIDEAAITLAREGLYTINDAADVSPDRLKRFFFRDGDFHRVKKEIREMVLFANHNFLKDPPFSKLDLISCRNVLIYLNTTAQSRVAETFHFALKHKRFLFLGTSESVDGVSDLFTTKNRDNHIFLSRDVPPRSYPIPESVPQLQYSRAAVNRLQDEERTNVKRISFGELHQRMLEQYAPPSVVVNEEYHIVHMSERAGKYFEFTGGEPTQNILKLISPTIRLELRAALYQSVQYKKTIEIHQVKLVVNGNVETLDIHIRPVLEEGDVSRGFILIIFKPAENVGQENSSMVVSSHEPVARQLEEELIGLKSQLRNSIEYHEYQAEALKASNEELQAMNEELRSAAEELETSREELQSINEELRTVNQELKVKIEETSITSNNLQNLINSADVGTIFLDRNFSIRLYTPAIMEIFNLKSGDYGRPITDITHKLLYKELLSDAETVLDKLTIVEHEVITTDKRHFMMRLLPYRTGEDRINGVVITFFDITRRKKSEEALRQSEERMRLLVEGAKDYAIFMIDPTGNVMIWNSGAELIFGYTDLEMTGKPCEITYLPEDIKAQVPHTELQEAMALGRSENERWQLKKDGTKFWGSGITQPLEDNKGNMIGFVKIMRDLTQHRELQEALRQSEEKYKSQLEADVNSRKSELQESKEQYSTLVENTPDLITRWDRVQRLCFANQAFLKRAGINANELPHITTADLHLKSGFVLPYQEGLRKVFESGETVEHFNTIAAPDGEVHFYSRLSPEINAHGEIDTVLAIARDITDMKNAELALHENRDLLQSILDNSSIAMSVLKPVRDESGNVLDFEIKLTNKELEKETGRTDLIGKHYSQEYPGIRSSGLFKVMLSVISNGVAGGLEYFYPHEGFNKWYSCMFVKMEDGLLATNMDITERKNAEEQLRSSEQRLRMFVSASSDLIYQMNADWTLMSVLKSDKILNDNAIFNQDWMKNFIPPNARKGFLSAINHAIANKEMLELEHQILLEGGSVGWAISRAIPMFNENGDLLEWFGVSSDITTRKAYEEQRDRNYLLLQQSEEVASTGTWDYDLSTGELNWSAGMYTLFEMKRDEAVDIDIYERLATQDCKVLASEIVQRFKHGSGAEDTIKVVVKESVKTLKLKSTVIRDERGTALRILGVDIDISESRLAEEKIRKMESKQQLEIFRATLAIQEEERRRISESLHNGLGQLLYGIKLSMNNLKLKLALTQPEEYQESKKYTDNLLTDAIRESRNISHKLMPAALDQFGLPSSIDEVCKQLNSGIKFHCKYKGLYNRLENYLELAIFRTVQELMLNVVKHSKATTAEVDVNKNEDQIEITVKDNGRGISPSNGSEKGIGLSSIRSKIKLLNGKFDISSSPENGTRVYVVFPLINTEL